MTPADDLDLILFGEQPATPKPINAPTVSKPKDELDAILFPSQNLLSASPKSPVEPESHGFVSGFTSSVQNQPTMYGQGLQAYGDVIGSNTGVGRSIKHAGEDIEDLSAQAPVKTLTWDDIESPGEVADWIAEQAGQGMGSMAMSMASSLIGAGAGAIAGTLVAGPVGTAPGAVIGGLSASGADAITANTGELRQSLIDAGVDEKTASNYAVPFGSILSIPDIAVMGKVLSKFGITTAAKDEARGQVIQYIRDQIAQKQFKNAGKTLAKETGKDIAELSLAEGATEMGQTVGQQGVVSYAADTPMLTKANLENVVTSGVAGAFGGAFGGAGGISTQAAFAKPTPAQAAQVSQTSQDGAEASPVNVETISERDARKAMGDMPRMTDANGTEYYKDGTKIFADGTVDTTDVQQQKPVPTRDDLAAAMQNPEAPLQTSSPQPNPAQTPSPIITPDAATPIVAPTPQGFAYGDTVEHVNRFGEVIEGTVQGVQNTADGISVTIQDRDGNVGTIFDSEGPIEIRAKSAPTGPTRTDLEAALNGEKPISPTAPVQMGMAAGPPPQTAAQTPPMQEQPLSLPELQRRLETVKAGAKFKGWDRYSLALRDNLQGQIDLLQNTGTPVTPLELPVTEVAQPVTKLPTFKEQLPTMTEDDLVRHYRDGSKKQRELAGTELKSRFPNSSVLEVINLMEAASQVNTAPTEGQKEAGNYKKGHVKIQGKDIAKKLRAEAAILTRQYAGVLRKGKEATDVMKARGEKLWAEIDKAHDFMDEQDAKKSEIVENTVEDQGKTGTQPVEISPNKPEENSTREAISVSHPETVTDQLQPVAETSQSEPESSQTSDNNPQESTEKASSFEPEAANSSPVLEEVENVNQDRKEFIHEGVKIYPTVANGKQYWAVQQRQNITSGKFMGDTLHDTKEEAIKQAEFDIRKNKSDDDIKARAENEMKAAEVKKEENRGKTIGERKAESVLDKPHNYSGKNAVGMGKTKREFVQAAIKRGWKFEEKSVADTAARKRDQDVIDRAKKNGYILGLSNENIPLVKDALAARDRLKADEYRKSSYIVNVPETKSFYDITKTEYDYSQTLEKPKAQDEQAADKIDDFGEKLHGAKKDLWQTYDKTLSDELPDDISQITLSKHFPEPNYENLIEGGADIRVLAAIKAMRDVIPTKPKKSYKLKQWAESVKIVRNFANKMLRGTLDYDYVLKRMEEESSKYGPLSEMADQIRLYAELGYPAFTRADGFKLSEGRYSYFNGQPYSPAITKFSVGKKNAFGQAHFDTREEAVEHLRGLLQEAPETKGRQVKLDIYRLTASGDIVIGKKVAAGKYIDLKTGFKKPGEARAYLKENEADLLELLEKKKTLDPERRSVNDPRVGTDYRSGEDTTPEKFASTFGFRGVQFGNYVEQGRRVKDLNNAYDALLDMANLMGIPPRAISLEGELGLAFGARGSGGKNAASAHYEPGSIVINLTKANGAGSLGHEWWHAMDHNFGKRREGSDFLTESPTQRKVNRDGTPAENKIRPEVVEAFDGVMKAIKSTGLYKRSKERDKTRSKDYWSTNIEMSARSLEKYLISKAEELGYKNDYLANIVPESAMSEEEGSDYAYPTKKEMETIGPAFDKLFKTIENKETDKGVALYSAAPALKSALVKTVDNLKQNKGSGEQMLAIIRNTQGVKEEEIAWTGLDDFLADKKTVTKQEIADYLAANQVNIEEVTLGSAEAEPISWDVVGDDGYDIGHYETREEAEAIAAENSGATVEQYQGDSLRDQRGDTKFSGYTLPGGTNYRELLIQMPAQDSIKYSGYVVPTNDEMADDILGDMSLEGLESLDYGRKDNTQGIEIIEFNDISVSDWEKVQGIVSRNGGRLREVGKSGSEETYKSSHFDQENILTHVRLNDRTDADGKKVLFVEEIQSDFGQALRKQRQEAAESLDNRWGAILDRMKKDGILEVVCP